MAKPYQSRIDRRRHYQRAKLKQRINKLSQRFPFSINPYRYGEDQLRRMIFALD